MTETPEQPDGTAPPPTVAPRVHSVYGTDIKIVHTTDVGFFLAIRKDGEMDLMANCSKEQALIWLRQLTQAIENGELGPGVVVGS